MRIIGYLDLEEGSRRPGVVYTRLGFQGHDRYAFKAWILLWTEQQTAKKGQLSPLAGGDLGGFSQRMFGSEDCFLGFGDVFRRALVAGTFVLFL